MGCPKRLAILAATVLALGGCGGGSAATGAGSAATSAGPASVTQQPSVVSTPAPTPTPLPTASPSPDLATLATKYTAISDAGNAALVACNKDRTAAAGSLTKAKAAAQECLTAYIGYVGALKTFNWGPAQPQADKVMADMDKIDALMVQMTNAPDTSTFEVAYDQLAALGATLLVDANAMRAALGLPPAS